MFLETLAVVFLIFLVFAVCSRLFFTVVDGVGGVCKFEEQLKDVEFGKDYSFEFDPEETCFGTGLQLTKGKTYTITLKLSDNWRDETIEADVNGWQSAVPWYVHLFTPLRRHLFVGWYRPIARVDNKLFDRSALDAAEPKPETDGGRQLTLNSEITAHKTGQLYLYLNDVVIFTPSLIKRFYKNNDGEAQVTVTEL